MVQPLPKDPGPLPEAQGYLYGLAAYGRSDHRFPKGRRYLRIRS